MIFINENKLKQWNKSNSVHGQRNHRGRFRSGNEEAIGRYQLRRSGRDPVGEEPISAHQATVCQIHYTFEKLMRQRET